jgi:dihydrofolate reductase
VVVKWRSSTPIPHINHRATVPPHSNDMIVSLIAAVATNGTIGHSGRLPWSIAEDMEFFTTTTKGHVVITGRKNFESMGGPLPERINLVLSREPKYAAPGARVCTDIETALRVAERLDEREVFVIGGAQVYAAAKPYAHRFYRTIVLAPVAGDVKYGDSDFAGWDHQVLAHGERNAVNEHAFRVELWSRETPDKRYA